MVDIRISCAFGIEKIVRTECKRLNYPISHAKSGALMLTADSTAIYDLNLWLRTAERVFIVVAEAPVTSFDELYTLVNHVPWHQYIAVDNAFPVVAKSKKSTLFSLSDIQSIGKKAIVDQLKRKYDVTWFDETADAISIHIDIDQDVATIMIDSSGTALHKRGYRTETNDAPLKETLAAALVLLSNWRGKRPLVDPMCGSGTILIEAALMMRNIAPGLNRNFAFEHFNNFDSKRYKARRQIAYGAIDYDKPLHLYGSDCDAKVIAIAKDNAENAGVDDAIAFNVADATALKLPSANSTLIVNPPYGERLADADKAFLLYRQLGDQLANKLEGSYYFLTSHPDFEAAFGRSATRNRKLYNGKIKCYYYQYPASNHAKDKP